MKYATLVSAILLGLVFVIFGLNYFFSFIPMPPMEGYPATFFSAIAPTGFLRIIKILEILFGAMLLVGFQRPLATILIAPIVIGILLFEVCIAGVPGIGVVLTALVVFLLYSYREKYMGILD